VRLSPRVTCSHDFARIAGHEETRAGGGVEAARIARVHRDGMNVLVESVVERLESRTVIARAEDAALLDADVHGDGFMRIEGDRTHVRNMRRRRKRPAIAARNFQEAVGLLEDAPAIVAAEQARVPRSR